ncbi:hypothetical protein Trydic_g20796 [Trypoxylus dichotomus]
MGRGKTLTEAERAQRSDYAIHNYLRDKENYAATEQERRKIIRIASNSAATARQIRDATGTCASGRAKKPVLTAQQREGRLNFARQHIQWTEDWKKVALMDEKRFSLDGPDGFQHNCHDLRIEPKLISHRPQGGRRAMILTKKACTKVRGDRFDNGQTSDGAIRTVKEVGSVCQSARESCDLLVRKKASAIKCS